MKLILRWVINAATIMLLAYYLPGISVSGWYAALIAALVLGLVNALIRPIFVFFTLPVTILTLGLFLLVINALMFQFVGSVVKGFTVADFMAAFWGALIMSLVGWLTSALFKNEVR